MSVAKDSGAQAFWAKNFGTEANAATSKVVDALKAHIKDAPNETFARAITLGVVASAPDSALVTAEELNLFAVRFGGFDNCFKKVKAALFDNNGKLVTYFHGLLTRPQAEGALFHAADQNASQKSFYLLRFSENLKDKLTLSYAKREAQLQCKTVIVYNTSLGFAFEESPKQQHAFPTVSQLIAWKHLSHAVAGVLSGKCYASEEKKTGTLGAHSNYIQFNVSSFKKEHVGQQSNYVQFNPNLANAALKDQQAKLAQVALPAPATTTTTTTQQAPVAQTQAATATQQIQSADSQKQAQSGGGATLAKRESNYAAFNPGLAKLNEAAKAAQTSGDASSTTLASGATRYSSFNASLTNTTQSTYSGSLGNAVQDLDALVSKSK